MFSEGFDQRFSDIAAEAAKDNGAAGFGTTAEQVRTNYLDLVKKLDTTPVTLSNGLTLTGDVVRQLTFALSYNTRQLPYIAPIWRLAAGKTDALGEMVLDQLINTPSTPNVPADKYPSMVMAIACGDVTWSGDVSMYAKNVAVDRAAHPLMAGMPANIWACAFWKNKPIEQPVRITNRGHHNILILQNRRDPATTWASGQGMRQALGQRAAFVGVDNGGHGVYLSDSTCAKDIVNAFLTSGALPPQDVSCPSSTQKK